MSDMINMNLDDNQEIGEIKISEEVISVVAGIAVSEVKGATVVNSIAEGLVEKFVKKNYGKGIKVILSESSADIDVHVNVDYGINIPDVAFSLQENVKKSVETFTDVVVNKVNIFVDGVNIPDDSKVKKSIKKSESEPLDSDELISFDTIEEIPEEIEE